MATDEVVDVDVTPPSSLEQLQDASRRIQRAISKTQEVMGDPEAALKSRQLPKAGTEKLAFETDEYLQDVEEARARMQASFEALADRKGDGEAEYVPLRYDAELIRHYYDKQPLKQVQRVAEVLGLASGYLAKLAGDRVTGKAWGEVERQRTIEARELIVDLGATFIKIGQAVSIRPDIISGVQMEELQKLCDEVPVFSNEKAFEIFESELGMKPTDVFYDMSAQPIASASIGQVYKARLKSTGEEVALKVQRPDILDTVSLDLCLLRKAAQLVGKLPGLRSDFPAILDEWAFRFYDEMNYVQEAENGLRFMRLMAPLREVTAPQPYFQLTGRKILTMEWIEGKRLVDAEPAEINRLVNIGTSCYLMQLLETGWFHADPHPGNMIRTEDGKLCILDFGLMSEVEDYQKFGMIRAITHLANRDYSLITKDFADLDFLPRDADFDDYTPALARVFDQALEGGGAKAINFNDLSADLAKITFDLPFRIPPYFALIIRAIGVLEGIALVGDEQFAVIDEAYPYIAKRLLTDDSEEIKSALDNLIYGPDGLLDVDRMIDLLESFEVYAKINSTAMEQGLMSVSRDELKGTLGKTPAKGQKSAQSVESTREALIFFFSEDGDYLRSLLEETITDGIDSLSKSAVAELTRRLRAQNLQINLPGGTAKRLSEFESVTLTEQDQKRVDQILKLWTFFGPTQENLGVDPSDIPFPFNNRALNPLGLDPAYLFTVGTEVGPYVPAIYPRMREFSFGIINKLNERAYNRLLNDFGLKEDAVPLWTRPPKLLL